MPPQAPRNGDALKQWAHTKQARCRLDPGEESGGLLASSLLTAWTLAPWACRAPSECSCPSLSFPCQRNSFTPSSEPLPRISRITEFLKCTIYSLKHILKRSSRNPKVSSLNKNNRKKTEITMSRVKKKKDKIFLTLNNDTDSENITKNIILILLKT